MHSVQDLAVNIVAAILVFGFGVSARGVLGRVRSRRGRKFWGAQIIRGRTYLFLGSFPRFNYLEPSGFIGLGDSHAVHELATTLGMYGASFDIAYASKLVDGQQRENIILVGLDEVNSLIPVVFARIGSGFRVDPAAMTVEDLESGELYSPEWEEDILHGDSTRDFDDSWSIAVGPDGKRCARRFRVDYGILIRATSPFAADRKIFVIAGIYGFGTWAGARLPLDEHFLRMCARHDDFECLYRVEVHQNQLLTISVVALRDLPRQDRHQPQIGGTGSARPG
ncbi:hypothetical protein [Actinoplanes sp. NPDC049599]|uniref:hypothetical protein n=1 Tax=Actinoplanes sp. NPDC049599 TaxID=3363903 RepID=UPI0037ABB32F